METKDAAEQTSKLGSLLGLPGRNSTAALHTDVRLLPTIDVCTLEFPDNYTPPDHIAGLRINACNLRKMHDHQQMLAEKERLERLATLPEELLLGQPPEGTSGHHIRHQRQHLEEANREFDPRSRIVGSTVILRREELQSLAHNRSSYSTVNR
ncbi:unnamed protein product [Acanthoscelides obtectus]|uniref:Uncharacterized protein n=1 Tax=Acanthoscelides obtectus TaxID=200917 RepID=A0A9P0KWR5_ACAOB|nr:unnamed protein product [Acanthoscelides obtectus]CAK1658350.1 hypothetical protein AOBTE_LOCUS20839 [Acanthoscelides obtectus]